MVSKRGRRHGSWLQRTFRSAESRKNIAQAIRFQRRDHWSPRGHHVSRNLAFLRERNNFDLEEIVRERLPKRGKLNLLDSGAGFLGISADLKRLFGDRVFVTAVNLMMPKLPFSNAGKVKQMLMHSDPLSPYYGPAPEPDIIKRYDELAAAHKNTFLVDKVRVKPIENFSTRRRYDIIIDIYASLTKAEPMERQAKILEKYFYLLRPYGSVFCSPAGYGEHAEIYFGKGTEFAKKNGYYFSVSVASEHGYDSVIEIKKLPLH
jgi:hypothetical protein